MSLQLRGDGFGWMGGLVILMQLRRRMSALRTTLKVPEGPEGARFEEVSADEFSSQLTCLLFELNLNGCAVWEEVRQTGFGIADGACRPKGCQSRYVSADQSWSSLDLRLEHCEIP
jgi:hypothetical protein